MIAPDTILDLGEIGTVAGTLRPIDLTLLRDGTVWNLTGYDQPEMRVYPLRAEAAITPTGTATILAPETAGVVRWTPDPAVFATSGVYEGRVWVRPPDAGAKEPSGRFRFTIGAR